MLEDLPGRSTDLILSQRTIYDAGEMNSGAPA